MRLACTRRSLQAAVRTADCGNAQLSNEANKLQPEGRDTVSDASTLPQPQWDAQANCPKVGGLDAHKNAGCNNLLLVQPQLNSGENDRHNPVMLMHTGRLQPQGWGSAGQPTL